MKERIIKNIKTTIIGVLTIGFGVYTLVYLKDAVQAGVFLTSGSALILAKDN